MAETRTISLTFDRAGAPKGITVPACRLVVIRGPDRKREKRLVKTRVMIGTGEGADFLLTDDTVSALHCELSVAEDGFKIEDLGAKNGVRLNGRRIVEAWLEEGDELLLGNTALRFKLLGEAEEQLFSKRTGFGRLRGGSVAMRRLYAELDRVVRSRQPVLLQGETGSGKELAAEALVTEGPRKDGPVVVARCASLTAAQLPPLFARAEGGTLVLDEVAELHADVQPALLAAIDAAQDVRIVSTTQHELPRAANGGAFRPDLYYRLAALSVRVPSLRERPEDVPILISAILDELPGAPSLKPSALQALYDGDYPGNVRELRDAVERAALGIAAAAPPPAPSFKVSLETPFKLQKEQLLEAFERAYLTRLMDACGGNVSEAARRSGLSRFHLHERLRKLKP